MIYWEPHQAVKPQVKPQVKPTGTLVASTPKIHKLPAKGVSQRRAVPLERGSHVSSVGYLVDAQILEVGFNDLTVYQYFGVPAELANEILGIDRPGKLLARRIYRNFPQRKLDPTEASDDQDHTSGDADGSDASGDDVRAGAGAEEPPQR